MTDIAWSIDVSNYQSADLTQIINQHKPSHVVVRASTESDQHRQIARQQLRTAIASGCTVSAYIWAYFQKSPTEHMADALSTVDGFPVSMIWIDCEDDCPPGQLDSYLSQAVALAESRGHRCGVYTGQWWWVANGDSQGFTRLPLWSAQYDEVPTLESVNLYGGWTSAAGKQWSTTGGTLDRDVFDLAVTVPSDPCTALRAELKRLHDAKPYAPVTKRKLASLLA